MKWFVLILILITFQAGCVNNNEHNVMNENKQISKVWGLETYEWILSSLYIYQNELFFGGTDKDFYCVDVESGKTKWKFKTEGECYFQPALSKDKIFFTTFDLFLHALNFDGKEVWKLQLPNRVKSSPVLYSGLVIISIRDWGMMGINAETGEVKWKLSQNSTNLSTTQPVLFSDILFVGNLNNTLSAFKPINGEVKWKLLYENMILSNASVYDTILVFGVFNPIYTKQTFINAVNIKTGKEIWRKNLDYNARYSPIAYGEKVYFGTENSEIICLNAINGAEIWKTKLEGDGIGSEFLLQNNRIYFGSYARNFYIMDAGNGKLVNKSSFNYGVGNPLRGQDDIFFGVGKGILYMVKE